MRTKSFAARERRRGSRREPALILAFFCGQWLFGCAEVGSQKPEVGNQKSEIRSLMPAAGVQSHVISPPTSDFRPLPFEFPRPLTNCYLQSSADLVHWENRYDFNLETNADESIGWRLPKDTSKPYEFYRTGGETAVP